MLLVDDNEDGLEVLSIFLESAGHEVVGARDGLDALAALRRFKPSVAVIDIGMPVMDGYQLARRLREHRGGERILLVALTGYGQATDLEQEAATRADEHLVKPVDFAQLLRVIARSRALPV